mmetsp:Transcript_1416/g.4453  ORF Transcript_1416/g.4453 Transcript_1416/m.4453 type:complete len:215 (-) Transcript_1416:373-1017(-)
MSLVVAGDHPVRLFVSLGHVDLSKDGGKDGTGDDVVRSTGRDQRDQHAKAEDDHRKEVQRVQRDATKLCLAALDDAPPLNDLEEEHGAAHGRSVLEDGPQQAINNGEEDATGRNHKGVTSKGVGIAKEGEAKEDGQGAGERCNGLGGAAGDEDAVKDKDNGEEGERGGHGGRDGRNVWALDTGDTFALIANNNGTVDGVSVLTGGAGADDGADV